MTQAEPDYKGLPLTTIGQAVSRALDEINAERGDEQLGLYCRWNGINRGIGKYWRFNHITQIASPSGHGKSYIANILHDDWTDFKDVVNQDGTVFKAALNKNVNFEVVIVHFGLEMDASDEVVRSLSRRMAKSYHYIMSSEYSHIEEGFNKVTDEEMNVIENRMNYIKDKPIYYVEMAGTLGQMWHTVGHVKEKHPNAKVIVTIDHTLLVRRSASEKSDDELLAAIAYFALQLRKQLKAMVVMLGQMNQNIKSVERMTTPALHYPNDSDIYRGSQVNWCCDNIIIMPYRPELINLFKYGTAQVPTKDLVIASFVKSRKGIIGDVLMKQMLGVGTFVEVNP